MKSHSKKKKIYLVFSYTGTAFSRLLRVITRSQYVHIGLSFDTNLENVYSFGRKEPSKMFPAGLVKENLKEVHKIFGNTESQIYEMKINDKNYKKLKKILKEHLKEQDKYSYDILGLPFIYFKKKYRRKYHRVCSQFVGYLLQESGVHDFNIDYSLITLNHFYHIENKELIYQGKLTKYLIEKDDL